MIYQSSLTTCFKVLLSFLMVLFDYVIGDVDVLKNQVPQTSKNEKTTNHRHLIDPASLPCSIFLNFFNCQKKSEIFCFLFLKRRTNTVSTMSFTEATERLEGAFLDADTKINNLTAKIDSTFKVSDDENARGPAELMETLVPTSNDLDSNKI